MRQKKMWRYFCDFCNKGGSSKSHMIAHEKSCTMNPNRECRMCKNIIEQTPTDISKLRALLIPPLDDSDKDEARTAELMDAANGCPACVLAAIRQENATRKPGDAIFLFSFNYERESKRIFEDKRNEDNESRGCW